MESDLTRMGLSAAAPVAASQPRALFRDLAAGLVCGLLAVVQSAGFGTLLTAAAPASFSSVAVGVTLFSSAVIALITAFGSSSPGVIAVSQGIPIAALSGVVASVVAAMAGRTGAEIATTIVVAIALSTLFIGIAAFALGWLKLGRFIRFVPYPVIGGFLAGSGWLILLGGIGVMLGRPLNLDTLGALPDDDTLLRGLVGVAFLGLLGLIQLRLAASVALPVAAIGALVAFDLLASIAGADGETLRAHGWVLSVAHSGGLWPPLLPRDLAGVDWHALLVSLAGLPSAALLSVIAILMNATGIELDARRDIDLDRELRTAGIANLAAGIGGGSPGFHSVTLSVLASRLAARGPLAGVAVALVCFAALLFGEVLLDLLPTPLLGGLLIFIGGRLVFDWLIRSWSKLSRWEYAVVVLIFAVIGAIDFGWGILVGLVAAALLFAVEYGRVEIVRHFMTGRDYQSGHDSSEERRELLRAAGEAILILRLQGFIFFGTADRLRRQIRDRIESHVGAPIQFLLIDFRRVSGLDSSTVLSFIRLAQMAEPGGFVLVLTGTSPEIRAALMRGGIDGGEGGPVRFEPDLDHGLEWCENELLRGIAPALVGQTPVPIAKLIADIVADESLAAGIIAALDRIEIDRGGKLIEQSKPSNDIYFIESGRAAVEFAASGQHGSVRVATVGRGAIVGEIAFYLGTPRSASVIAEAPLVAWRFPADRLDMLRRTKPEAAIAFHRGMARMLAARLTASNRVIRLLAD